MTQAPAPTTVPPTEDADKIVEGSFNPDNSVAQSATPLEREAALERQRLHDAGLSHDSGYPTVAAGVAGQTDNEGRPVYGTPVADQERQTESADADADADAEKLNLPPQTTASADGGQGVAPEAHLPAEAVEGQPQGPADGHDERQESEDSLQQGQQQPQDAPEAEDPDRGVIVSVGADGRPASSPGGSTLAPGGASAPTDSEGGEAD